MKLTAHQIAEMVGGVLTGGSELVLTGAAGISEAGPGDVSFVGNEKYVKHIKTSKAGLLFVTDKINPQGRAAITVRDPQLAFAQVLTYIEQERKGVETPAIHPSAIIAASAQVGPNVSVGPYAVIEDGVTIGAGTRIRAHCFIGKNTRIGTGCLLYPSVTIRENAALGNNVIIHPAAVIGADGFGFTASDKGIFKIPQLGTVAIGDDVEIGANVTVDRATTGTTTIGSGTKIDNLVQIAHNVQIGSNCIIVTCVCIAGSTKIGNNVTIGGQVAIAGHLHIGDGVTIAGKSGISTDIAAGETVSGFPAQPHRTELKMQALVRRLPELFEDVKKMKGKK